MLKREWHIDCILTLITKHSHLDLVSQQLNHNTLTKHICDRVHVAQKPPAAERIITLGTQY